MTLCSQDLINTSGGESKAKQQHFICQYSSFGNQEIIFGDGIHLFLSKINAPRMIRRMTRLSNY